MKSARNIGVYFLLVVCSVVLAGCGGKADETKPMSEVKAEAEKMDAEQLRTMAMKYKEAILAKKAEGAKLAEKLKEIPVTELLGSEAKQLKGEIENLNKSVSALMVRFNIYYNQLKEKKGDLSGLEI